MTRRLWLACVALNVAMLAFAAYAHEPGLALVNVVSLGALYVIARVLP